MWVWCEIRCQIHQILRDPGELKMLILQNIHLHAPLETCNMYNTQHIHKNFSFILQETNRCSVFLLKTRKIWSPIYLGTFNYEFYVFGWVKLKYEITCQTSNMLNMNMRGQIIELNFLSECFSFLKFLGAPCQGKKCTKVPFQFINSFST